MHNSRSRNLRRPSFEILENRLACATLVSPTTVTFADFDGDHAKVQLSKPLFTAANVEGAFLFDNQTFESSDPQRLLLLDFVQLGGEAQGLSVKVTAEQANGGDGQVHVGFLNADSLDLKSVSIAGDLAKIFAGDATLSTPGVRKLKVQSMGAFGLDTQGGVGNFESTVAGSLNKWQVTGDVKEAHVNVSGNIGKVTIAGSLIGGTADNSGKIEAGVAIGLVKIGADIRGGFGLDSGMIFGFNGISSVVLKGSIAGGDGENSGSVAAPSGNLGSILINGSLLGGAGQNSGFIHAELLGPVNIHGDIIGGSASSAMVISSDGTTSVTVGGSLVGDGQGSGIIGSSGPLGPVEIGHDVLGGKESFSGCIVSFLDRIVSVHIGGSLKSGDALQTGSIFATHDIGQVLIDGNMVGTFDSPVEIRARGQSAPKGTSDLAIGKLTVNGSVQHANIVAGRPLLFILANADAQIGRVTVGGDWLDSNLVAGADAGSDSVFGTVDDLKLHTGTVTDRPEIMSKILSVVIRGQVGGTATVGDHLGFVAEDIGSIIVNGVALALSSGPHNDDFLIVGSNNVSVNEI